MKDLRNFIKDGKDWFDKYIDRLHNYADKLQESEEWLEITLKSIGDGVIATNNKGIIKFMNVIAEELTGWSEDEAKGKPLNLIFKIINLDTREPMENPVSKVLRKGKVVRLANDTILISRNGKEIPIDDSGAPIIDEDGNVNGVVLIFRDIRELKQSQNHLQNKVQELDKILRGVTDTIARFDKNLRHLYINPIVEKELGISRDNFIGKTNRELGMPEEVVKGWEEALRSVFESGEEIRYEVSYPSADGGTDYYENKIIPEFNQQNEVESIITMTRNITRRKRAEIKLIEAYNRSNFYKDLLAHDMANVLNNVKVSFNLMKNWAGKSTDSDKYERVSNIIQDQLERGASLISNVRRVSEIETEKITLVEKIDIEPILEDAIKYINSRFENKQISVSKDFSDTNLKAQGGELLRHAFENILLNGVFHNQNEQIKLWIKASIINKNGRSYVRLDFEDNGIGIIDERKNIIFERRDEQGKSTGGMGIGLSLVKKIIDEYDGEIQVKDRVENNPSEGSNFIILLPKE
ncbi:MAG: PAS domain S-box protein [Candidatus Lokiarchaeota archaeon]|nr:PAS domain S-box protein [Candidatus Lokiarchaeota archaeon]MBD3202409.1 PAS domain S-box protein [Candidatus Lokiarchaeota archaeon]